MGKSGGSHTVMPKKLAEALMEAGVQHFDFGGDIANGVGSVGGGGFGILGQQLSGMDNSTAINRIGRPGQSNYDAGAPVLQNQVFGPRIGQLQNQQDQVYQQQQNLANALLSQSQGQGPNPAQAQLVQNTGNNVSQQAALMASQRGANANPALLARQAAMQGAGIQQNAVGQAATLQAQQQLAAQQALAQQQSQMFGQSLQGESIQQGGLASQNTAQTAGSLGSQQINAQTAQANANASGKFLGMGMNAIGAAFGLAEGGEVHGIQHYDAPPIPGQYSAPSSGEQDPSAGKAFGKALGSAGGGGEESGYAMPGGGGGQSLMPSAFAQGGPITLSSHLLSGGNVPGKAEVKGNSKENDKVPVLLSPGEEVIDRETMQDPGPVGKAARMVAAHIKAKNGGQDPEEDDGGSAKSKEFMKHLKGKKKGYGGVIEARACGGKIK